MKCLFCGFRVSEYDLICKHKDILIKYSNRYSDWYADPNSPFYFIYYIKYNDNIYSLLLEKDTVTVYQLIPISEPEDYYQYDMEKIMKINHEIFPPEEAYQKIQKFLKLTAFL